MKRKPAGLRYCNLHARADSIYYERVWQGKRICFSTKTDDWTEAAAVRDLYEERKGIGRLGVALRAEAPRFAEFVARHMVEDTAHLAPTTREERVRYLSEAGPIVPHFGALRIDEITSARLRQWWTDEVTAKGRSTKTGRNYLDALAAVLGFGVELELLEDNPVDAFRMVLRRKTRTQRGRAESDLAATFGQSKQQKSWLASSPLPRTRISASEC